MSKNSLIKMRKTNEFSNPAKNEVVEASNDCVLSNYIREISVYAQHTAEEEREIAKRAQEGDECAKNELIKANLKLVVTIAKKAIKEML